MKFSSDCDFCLYSGLRFSDRTRYRISSSLLSSDYYFSELIILGELIKL